jgi:hypothetical protein
MATDRNKKRTLESGLRTLYVDMLHDRSGVPGVAIGVVVKAIITGSTDEFLWVGHIHWKMAMPPKPRRKVHRLFKRRTCNAKRSSTHFSPSTANYGYAHQIEYFRLKNPICD